MDAADIAALDAAESSFQAAAGQSGVAGTSSAAQAAAAAQSGKKKMRITCKWARRSCVFPPLNLGQTTDTWRS
jgi:hypothetical protein